jgi:peptidoglycan hydrolase-like protein with peptidoglycan-binding domain
MNRHGWARSLALTGGLLALTSVAVAGGDEKSDQSSKERESSSAASSPAKSENTPKGSPQIEAAQRKLAAQKMYTGKIDGLFGAQTRAAIEKFQGDQGIPVSGNLDTRTMSALGIGSERVPVAGESGTERIELSSLSAAQIRKLQQRLQQLGTYQGAIDGVMGKGTQAALRGYFERQAKLADEGAATESGLGTLGVTVSARENTSGSESSSRTGDSRNQGAASR